MLFIHLKYFKDFFLRPLCNCFLVSKSSSFPLTFFQSRYSVSQLGKSAFQSFCQNFLAALPEFAQAGTLDG